MHETQSGTRLLVTIVQRLTIRCRDGELIKLVDLHTKQMHINGLNHDKDGTYNSININMLIG